MQVIKTLTDKGNGDAYVVKVANNGQTDWAVSAGSSASTERAYAVEVTSNGDHNGRRINFRFC